MNPEASAMYMCRRPTQWGLRVVVAVAALAALAAMAEATLATTADPRMQAFAEETDAAMSKMMAAMHVQLSGDVDRDFAAMMIPHHQGAIDMAMAELRHGRNETLRRLAQEIVVAQQQEIVVMQRALGDKAGPGRAAASKPAAAIGHRDRVYAAEQFSNTVSVTDPADQQLLGFIRLGDPSPANFSPLYRGQVLVHGMGFSPDHRTLAVVSIGSNSVTFIDTATNAVKHTTYVGRSPHEAFYTPDGNEVWVTVRGENYVLVIDAVTYQEKTRITTPGGPGMQIFSPDGRYGYVCSSFNPETVVVEVATHTVVGRVKQDSPFCPNIAATPDGDQVWLTLKDTGRTMVFEAGPPFAAIRSIDTGAITNHVNFARTAQGTLAYVTVGGLNVVKVFRTDDFSLLATIPVGKLPHGVWPSDDGTRVFVALENDDMLVAIDTASNTVVGRSPVGQAPQALVYVSDAVPEGDGRQGLEPIGVTGKVATLTLIAARGAAAPRHGDEAPTSVALFDQGLLQVLEASVTGLRPAAPYVLALADRADGSGPLQPLADFMTNPAGAAIVNAIGPIRQVVGGATGSRRRYLVVAPKVGGRTGPAVQVQARDGHDQGVRHRHQP